MKKAILLYLLTLTTITVFSQKWEQIYGKPNNLEVAEDIIEYYDKGYYIFGLIEEGNMNYLGWHLKTDINGDSLYNKYIYHNLYHHVIHGSVIDEFGNLYVCGTIFLDDSWSIIAKYDPCGQNVWCRVIIDDNFDDGKGNDIQLTKDGNIIALVSHDSYDQVDQILLYCLSNDGDFLWSKSFASKNEHPEIGLASANNLYHYNNSYFIDGYCYWPYPGNPGQVYLRPLFIKIDSLFNEEWILPFGVSDSIIGEAYGIVALNDSIYFGIGVRVSSATYNQNSLLMFFNEDGEEIGYTQILNKDFGENVDFNTMWNIVKANDTSFVTKFYIGINDTVFHGETVIDTSGSLLKIKNRGPGNGIADIIKTSDNNFLQVTEVEESKGDKDIWLYKFDKNLEPVPFDTNTYVYDSLCPGGIQSGTIDITNCLIWTNVVETPSPQEYYTSLKTIHIKAYPNPVKDGNITFEFKNTSLFSDMELKCFDVFGREVNSEKVYQNQGASIVDVSKWKAGIYLANVYSKGQLLGSTKFIVSSKQ